MFVVPRPVLVAFVCCPVCLVCPVLSCPVCLPHCFPSAADTCGLWRSGILLPHTPHSTAPPDRSPSSVYASCRTHQQLGYTDDPLLCSVCLPHFKWHQDF